MKKILALFTLLLCIAAAYGQKPIQIQTVDSNTFVVEYIPIADAQANVQKQLVQTEKQLAQVDKQISELVAKRDALIKQQAALKYLDAQLTQATTTPTSKTAPAPTTPPAEPPKTGTGKTKKKKN